MLKLLRHVRKQHSGVGRFIIIALSNVSHCLLQRHNRQLLETITFKLKLKFEIQYKNRGGRFVYERFTFSKVVVTQSSQKAVLNHIFVLLAPPFNRFLRLRNQVVRLSRQIFNGVGQHRFWIRRG